MINIAAKQLISAYARSDNYRSENFKPIYPHISIKTGICSLISIFWVSCTRTRHSLQWWSGRLLLYQPKIRYRYLSKKLIQTDLPKFLSISKSIPPLFKAIHHNAVHKLFLYWLLISYKARCKESDKQNKLEEEQQSLMPLQKMWKEWSLTQASLLMSEKLHEQMRSFEKREALVYESYGWPKSGSTLIPQTSRLGTSQYTWLVRLLIRSRENVQADHWTRCHLKLRLDRTQNTWIKM